MAAAFANAFSKTRVITILSLMKTQFNKVKLAYQFYSRSTHTPDTSAASPADRNCTWDSVRRCVDADLSQTAKSKSWAESRKAEQETNRERRSANSAP